jgi:uncharacterized Fe-S cluster protein YjdI
MKEIIKEYSNGEVTVVWKPNTCIHSEVCIKTLPAVYDLTKKPWINADNATTEELISQIKKCPSGALSYYMNGEDNKEEAHLETSVEVLKDGPLLVYGTLNVTHKDGRKEIKNKTTAFCRCGGSGNKPFCDGTHMKNGFTDS